jgi:hypothetical protein
MPTIRAVAVTAAALSAAAALAQGALASPAAAPNSASCLRGHWVASTAESQRVLKLMVPGPYTFTAKLYMDFRVGTMAYGTPAFVIDAGGVKAEGSFVTLHGYRATRGRIDLRAGTTTTDVMGHEMTGRVPAAAAQFECNASRLRYRMPGPVGWMTLNRARS